jgi:hypothetical protein
LSLLVWPVEAKISFVCFEPEVLHFEIPARNQYFYIIILNTKKQDMLAVSHFETNPTTTNHFSNVVGDIIGWTIDPHVKFSLEKIENNLVLMKNGQKMAEIDQEINRFNPKLRAVCHQLNLAMISCGGKTYVCSAKTGKILAISEVRHPTFLWGLDFNVCWTYDNDYGFRSDEKLVFRKLIL